MKILHMNSYYSNRFFYKNLYDKQIDDGLDIDVYVPVPYSYKKPEKSLGTYTRICPNHGKYDRILFHLKHNKIYKDIVKQYKIKQYSLVHAHSLFSNGYIAMRLKQDFGTPYIVAVRNTDIYTFFKYMIHLRRLGVRILHNAEKLVFLSETYRDKVMEECVPSSMKEEIFNKAIIIPNGIDDFWLANKGDVKKTPDINNLRLLYVGVIDKVKNVTTTVKAVRILRQQGYNVEYTIVGKIEDQSIYGEIKNIPYVNYIQQMPKEELIKVYRSNDIFVMPSIYETFGLVYAEAISQGLPVIYTKGEGFDGQFENGKVGYSVDCYDPHDIANKIVDVVNNYSLLTKNCIELCSKFDWNKLQKQYRSVYQECLTI